MTVLVETASGITDLPGLVGKTVGVSSGSTSAKALATAMQEAGLIPTFDADTFDASTFSGGVTFKQFDDYPAISIALGAGDVKLLGVCTPFLPCDEMLSFLFCTMVIGAFLGILHFAYYGNALERFRYLAAYIRDCLAEKRWKLYEENSRRSRRTGICMAGPILISTLLYLGGIY